MKKKYIYFTYEVSKKFAFQYIRTKRREQCVKIQNNCSFKNIYKYLIIFMQSLKKKFHSK